MDHRDISDNVGSVCALGLWKQQLVRRRLVQLGFMRENGTEKLVTKTFQRFCSHVWFMPRNVRILFFYAR